MASWVWREARKRARTETLDIVRLNDPWKALQVIGVPLMSLFVSWELTRQLAYSTGITLACTIAYGFIVYGAKTVLGPAQIAAECYGRETALKQAQEAQQAHQEQRGRQFPEPGSVFERALGVSRASILLVVPSTTQKELHKLIDDITEIVRTTRDALGRNQRLPFKIGATQGRQSVAVLADETVKGELARAISDLYEAARAADGSVCEKHLEAAGPLRDRLNELHGTAHQIDGIWKALSSENVSYSARVYALSPLYAAYTRTANELQQALVALEEYTEGLRKRLA
jgi:hypothetical protein